jgi:subtilisin family serine protease
MRTPARTRRGVFQGNTVIRIVRRPIRAASLLALCVGLAQSVALAAPASPAPLLPQAERDAQAPTDRFIVVFRDDAPEHRNAIARTHFLDAVGKRQGGLRLGHARRLATGGDLLTTDRKLDVHAAKRLLVELARDPRVLSVEVDRLHRPQGTPNDPRYPEQFYLQRSLGIDAVTAWNRSMGGGAVVAVIDSGLTSHADLAANRVAGYDFIADVTRSNDGNGRDADASDAGNWNAYSECGDTGSAYDSTWHGTRVAGIIAAAVDNATGIVGVAPRAKIMPVRVLGKCGGYTSDIVDAITWASGGSVAGVPANGNPAEVINLSLATSSFDGCSASMQAAITGARSRGAVVVASTVDGSIIPIGSNMPIGCAGVIGVGASNNGKAVNGGSDIDILAPGGDDMDLWSNRRLLTTTDTGTSGPAGDGYTLVQGASYSAAQVSATIALMQSIRAKSPDAVEGILRRTATPTTGCASPCPRGIVDAAAATRDASMPVLWIEDPAGILEGASGAKVLTFTARLSEALTSPVTFTASTANGTAASGGDYVARTLGATIPAGATSVAFDITINGDGVPESDDTFFVNLSSVTGVLAVDTQAQGTILNDDLIELTPTKYDQVTTLTTTPRQYFFTVPVGATDVKVRTVAWSSGSSGDVDLFVKKGAMPSRGSYDCASTAVGNNELCDLGGVSGQWFVLLDTLTNYTKVSIYVSWTASASASPLSIADVTVVEGDSGSTAVDLVVTRPVAMPTAQLFQVTTTGGTVDDSDVWGSSSIPGDFFPAGATSMVVHKLYVRGDTTVEPVETLNMALSSTEAAIADGTATLTIVDDDGVTLMAQDLRASEGGNAAVRVVLTEPSATDVTFQYATANGAAVAGTDYTAKSGTATIPAGQTEAIIPVAVLADGIVEMDEAFAVVVSNPVGARVTDVLARVTIADGDAPRLDVVEASFAEGNSGTKMAAITVALSKAAPYPVSFVVSTSSAGATAGVDYRQIWLEETIPAGMATKVIYVPILGDTAVESNEAFNVTLTGITGAANTQANALAWILNDEGPLLSINDVTIAEGNAGTKQATFTVSLSQAVAGPVTFDVGPQQQGTGATATAGSDYTWQWLLGATIPAGQLARTFAVTVKGDTTAEANEFVDILVENTQGATAFDGRGRLTITNDDVPGISIADASVAEGDSGTRSLAFTVTLSGVSPTPVTFDVATTAAGNATAGTDYVALNLTGLTIPAGTLSRTVSVTLNGDTTIEATEYLVVGLTNVSGANVLDGAALGTIINDDQPTLSIADAGVAEGNSGTTAATFTVTLSRASPFAVTFNAATTASPAATATAGVDYTAQNLTGLTIPAGALTKTFTVPLLGDTTIEANEVYVVAVSNVANALVVDGTALGTIINDDKPLLAIADLAISEGNSGTKQAVFTVTLSQPAPYAITFDAATTGAGNATAGTDFVALNATGLSIPAGQTAKTVAVTINGDTTVEANEYYVVAVANAVGAIVGDGTALGTITNDD